jgi:hypothetical protein
MEFNQLVDVIQETFDDGNFVVAYYNDKRAFQAESPTSITSTPAPSTI